MKPNVRLGRAALTAAFLMATAVPGAAQAESLWDRRDPRRAFLFYDVSARHKGDVITVIINEATDVQNIEDRALSKESSASKSMDVESAATGDYGGPVGAANFNFNSDSERTFDGSATFNSNREFSTRIAATVTEVLPNGNMVIEARRNVIVAGDERILVMSGIVRPYDVAPGNFVQSRNIAQFRIAYEGNGQEQSFTRQGIFGRVMNKLWPF